MAMPALLILGSKMVNVLVQGVVGGVIGGLFVCVLLYIFKYRHDK